MTVITGLTRGGEEYTPEFVTDINQANCIGCGRCFKVCPRDVFDLVDREAPLLVYIVGGEPLVRFRELNEILPQVCARTVETHLVTSAVRPIPAEWAKLDNLRGVAGRII